METSCPKCKNKKIVKNGNVRGKQRYKCQICGYQFSKKGSKGTSIAAKLLAHGLYECGMSMNKTAEIIGVSKQSISRWIKDWHGLYKEELGNKEILYEVTRESISDCLNLREKEKYIVISNSLPSGTKINIIIQPKSE